MIDETDKADAIYCLEKAIFALDGVIDPKVINVVSKLKSILIFIKRYL